MQLDSMEAYKYKVYSRQAQTNRSAPGFCLPLVALRSDLLLFQRSRLSFGTERRDAG